MKTKETLLYLWAKLIQLQQEWSVPAASKVQALRQWVVGESINVLRGVCVGERLSGHDAVRYL